MAPVFDNSHLFSKSSLSKQTGCDSLIEARGNIAYPQEG